MQLCMDKFYKWQGRTGNTDVGEFNYEEQYICILRPWCGIVVTNVGRKLKGLLRSIVENIGFASYFTIHLFTSINQLIK